MRRKTTILLNGKRWRIVMRKLGRERAHAQCWPDGLIEIDIRLAQKRKLAALFHELFHAAFPDMADGKCESLAKSYAAAVWLLGFRELR